MNLHAFLHIHKEMPLGFHCTSYKIHIMSPPLYYAELSNPVLKKPQTLYFMRDCSHPHIPAQLLLIRTRWTNPGEGKWSLRRQGRCWVHPQGSLILCSGDKSPPRAQHHKVKPSTILEGRGGPVLTQLTHSWGKLASCWDTGKSLATRRNSKEDTWARWASVPCVTFSN